MSSQQISYLVCIIIFASVFITSVYVLIQHKYIHPRYKDYQLWLSFLYIIVSTMFIFLYVKLLVGILVGREELRLYIIFAGFTLLVSALEVAIRKGIADPIIERLIK